MMNQILRRIYASTLISLALYSFGCGTDAVPAQGTGSDATVPVRADASNADSGMNGSDSGVPVDGGSDDLGLPAPDTGFGGTDTGTSTSSGDGGSTRTDTGTTSGGGDSGFKPVDGGVDDAGNLIDGGYRPVDAGANCVSTSSVSLNPYATNRRSSTCMNLVGTASVAQNSAECAGSSFPREYNPNTGVVGPSYVARILTSSASGSLEWFARTYNSVGQLEHEGRGPYFRQPPLSAGRKRVVVEGRRQGPNGTDCLTGLVDSESVQ